MPLLHATSKCTRRGSSASRVTSKAVTTQFLGFLSTVSPRRAALYRRSPLTLMAEYMGGIWTTSPTNFRASSVNRWSLTCSHGKTSSTSVHASWLGVPSPSRIVPVYRLSMPVNVSTSFVALPTHRMSRPVAIGSSVPQWPTFFTPAKAREMPRVFPTTSNDVHPGGLSTRRTMFCHVSASAGAAGGRRKCGGGIARFAFFFFVSGGVADASEADADDETHRADGPPPRQTTANERPRARARKRGREPRAISAAMEVIARVMETPPGRGGGGREGVERVSRARARRGPLRPSTNMFSSSGGRRQARDARRGGGARDENFNRMYISRTARQVSISGPSQ